MNRDEATLDSDEADSSARTARVGEVLSDRYELLRKIGEGGMGEVYEARHTTLERVFAIKLLHPELARSQRMLRRFSREALAASRLSSDHIVSALDCGHTAEGIPYFVMERLRGCNLRTVLRRERRLSLPRAVRIAIDVCRGLHVAHLAGLVHRDLKPENLFLVRGDDGQESAKLLDFGLVLGAEGTTLGTQPGGVAGTTRYMAPEQLRGATVDARADLYALGVLLYESLAGEVPHPGDSAEAIMFHALHEAAKPLAEWRPELPASLCSVVHRALHGDADARYRTAQSLADALLPYAGEALPRVGVPPSIEVSERDDAGSFAAITTRDDARASGSSAGIAPARIAPSTASSDAKVAPRRSTWPLALALGLVGLAAVALLRGPGSGESRPHDPPPQALSAASAEAALGARPTPEATPPSTSLPVPSASSAQQAPPSGRQPVRAPGRPGAPAGSAQSGSVFDSENPYVPARP